MVLIKTPQRMSTRWNMEAMCYTERARLYL